MKKKPCFFIGAILMSALFNGCGGDGAAVNGPDTGAIRVTTSTTGEDLDPDGYTCRIDGGAHSQSIGINDSHTFSSVATGEHSVGLTGLEANCAVIGDNPQSVAILIAGQTVTAAFNVDCLAMTGSLAVTIVTAGDTLDPDGYTVTVDGTDDQAADIIDIVTFGNLRQGTHSIELTGIAKNCSLVGDNPRDVNVTSGQMAEATFNLTCTAALFDRIIFHSDRAGSYDLYLMRSDGSDLTRLTSHDSAEYIADVSPDGSRILFASDRDGNDQIYVMNADGTDVTNLTIPPDYFSEPRWSPDGGKIAFMKATETIAWDIWVMNPDGKAKTQLTDDPATDWYPTWSPDGSEIAFVSRRSGSYEIYVMSASDGGNVRQLTNNQENESTPAWSPDGTKIAYTKNVGGNIEVYVMNADGSNERALSNNPASDLLPAWSPDGSKIVFATDRDGNQEIYIMNADGSGQTRLTFDDGHDSWPRWTPTR